MKYVLYVVCLDGRTLKEIDREEVLQHENRLLVESMLEFPTSLIQNIYQHKQSQHKNAMTTFQVLRV